MTTTRTTDLVYLDPEKFAALKALAASTRIPKSVLYREAVDLLLEKYAAPKAAKGVRPK